MTTAVAAVAALYFTGQTLRATNAQNSTTRESAITDRLAKATEQLSSEKINSQLAGIYLLERLANDSPTDRGTTVELLSAYVRNEAPASKCTVPAMNAGPGIRLAANIQAAITVLGRMPHGGTVVDLSYACLVGADMKRGNFSNTLFNDSVLARANFVETNLSGSLFRDANFQLGNFNRSNLSYTFWGGANATSAVFVSTDVTGAEFLDVDISGADLSRIDGLTLEHFILALDKPYTIADAIVHCDQVTDWPEGFTPPRCSP
ncbi:pentapeptide repeat-containing protein [Nocardia sp. FBN12]|uniref:pentapeptide repeat-containing protein n=1 Tax=Nocardia sp. FBN12 TaxID=3419766 RepID=UPI003D075F0A